MRDDHPPMGDVGRDLGQALRDVFVRQSMKAVAPHPLFVQAPGNRKMIGKRVMAAMEGGIEASDLRQLGSLRQQRADRRQVVGLVQRCERDVTIETGEDFAVDQHRTRVFGTAVYDAMADGDEIDLLRLAQPRPGSLQRRREIAHLVRRVGAVDQRFCVGAFGAQPRPRADPVHLALDQALEIAASPDLEDLELEARGAGIDDEDRVHGGHAAGTAAVWRRASA